MKCHSCIYLVIDFPTQDDPYGGPRCSKGHWDGGPEPEPTDVDPWKDCTDYEKEIYDAKTSKK